MTGDRNDQLLQRLVNFAKKVIKLCQKLPNNSINSRLISQAVGSTGSEATNYAEACEAESWVDFIHKIRIAKKEARESSVNLTLLATANTAITEEIKLLEQENEEYLKIFSTIIKNCTKKPK